MTRRVDADVVIAGLHQIIDGLTESGSMPSVKVSSAKQRARHLVQTIENQAVTDGSRVSHTVTLSELLEGATEPPVEGQRLTMQQFVSAWNNASTDDRASWWAAVDESQAAASRCFMENHAALVERERMSWLSSHDLLAWAERMRDFALWWDENPHNSKTIHTLIRMQGPDDDRQPVEKSVASTDLVIAGELARRQAHDHISYAVMVDVKHYERKLGKGAEREQAEIIVIDGRVLLDDVAVDELMTQSGWVER